MENISHKTIAFTIIIIALIGGYFIYSSGQKNPTPVEVSQKSEDTIKSLYMNGCMDSDTPNYQLCSCTYDAIKAKYGLDGMINLADKMDGSGNLPDGVMGSVANCYQYIQ